MLLRSQSGQSSCFTVEYGESPDKPISCLAVVNGEGCTVFNCSNIESGSIVNYCNNEFTGIFNGYLTDCDADKTCSGNGSGNGNESNASGGIVQAFAQANVCLMLYQMAGK